MPKIFETGSQENLTSCYFLRSGKHFDIYLKFELPLLGIIEPFRLLILLLLKTKIERFEAACKIAVSTKAVPFWRQLYRTAIDSSAVAAY